ncbi:MAG: transcription factor [Halobacteriota archaeon]|nr:transcription factor [Halobacteriota archaeon]
MAIIDDPSIKEYLRRLVDDEGLKVIEKIPDGEVTDEKLAELTELKLNTVRKTLYILYENRLAEYRRERDDESGWLTYLWKVDFNEMDDLIKSEMAKLLKNLGQRLKYESDNVFYFCRSNCGRFIFDIAAKTDFKCPVCDMALDHYDNQNTIRAIEEKLMQLRNQ